MKFVGILLYGYIFAFNIHLPCGILYMYVRFLVIDALTGGHFAIVAVT
jgi:hypothetical protein